MGKRIRACWGLTKQSVSTRSFLDHANMRAAVYVSAIVIALESWMILSLLRSYFEGLAAGKHRDLPWLVNHGSWYVVLLVFGVAVLIHSLRYARGLVRNRRFSRGLLWAFSIACIAFGIYYGCNSYAKGEQVLAFVTMTLFVFGLITWRPIPSLVFSTITFGAFYLLISQSAPPTYGTQVNLFTLWISTFVVALASYHQKESESQKEQRLKEINERLQYIATHDALTKIPTMHTFRSAVGVLLEGIDELGTRFSILYMDVENFKSYNERHGFLAGDELLCDLAHGLQDIFANELVARFSDDHFTALCEVDVAEERVEAARALVRSLRGDVRLHLKAGAFEPTSENTDVGVAIDKARIACNETKRRPDRFFYVYDTALDLQVERRHHIINSIKTAASDGWIKVYYQPVVRCSDGSGELCDYEVLARWDDPTYGLLPPFAFIETLEEYREIDKLDRCIIEQVCRDLRAELDAGKPVVPVSLNFSRLDFELYDVPAFLREMTQKYDVPSNLLDVEITESALTEQLSELQKTMASLREGQFSLWLDDFGSGYSSLNVLKDFRFNVLKIDMAFLRGFPQNEKAGPILESIVMLAKELNMVTLCEGVETKEQFDFLHAIGCDRAQGYYFGKPDAQKKNPIH